MLPKRTAFEKVLCDKTFNIAKKSNMKDIKEVHLQWSTVLLLFLDKMTAVDAFKNGIMQNKQ